MFDTDRTLLDNVCLLLSCSSVIFCNILFNNKLECHNKKELVLIALLQNHNSYNTISVRVMVFNATFNTNSVISRLSILLVEETGVP